MLLRLCVAVEKGGPARAFRPHRQLVYPSFILGKEQLKRLETWLSLIKEATSLEIVADFLKQKKAPSSAQSWKSMFEDRVIYALNEKLIEEEDLWELLDEAEENGHQHIFLYQGNAESVAHCLKEARIRKWAEEKGVSVDDRRINVKPAKPTICGVRLTKNGSSVSMLTIQIVETRTSYVLEEENEDKEFITRRWRIVKERAVNVARLRAEGLLEIRVRSHANSRKYKDNIGMVLDQIGELISADGFRPKSLKAARKKLFEKKEELASELRYSDTVMRNDRGNVLTGATGGAKRNLWDDEAVRGSFDSFASKDGAVCTHQNVWWKKGKDGVPTKDVHVKLGDEDNEFAIPAAARLRDYEHVLTRILRHGRP